MQAIKTKPHNFIWRSVETKSRDVQLLNTEGCIKLGKQLQNLFHLQHKTQSADVFCQHEGPSVSSCVWRRTPHQYGLQLSNIAWLILRLLYLVELAFTLRFELCAAHFFFLWRRGAVHVWVEQSINCSGPGRQRWGETAGLQSCFCSCGPCPPLSPSSSSACWLQA